MATETTADGDFPAFGGAVGALLGAVSGNVFEFALSDSCGGGGGETPEGFTGEP